MTPAEARALLADAEEIHSSAVVTAAVGKVAEAIRARLSGAHPLLLCVMSGGVPFAGQLLTQLDFPLDFDYVHVSRYGDATTGSQALSWRSAPHFSVQGRLVLLLDDILDEGITLAAIKERLLAMGAAQVLVAVFADKHNGKVKPIQADFVGLSVPDRFVFGFGMDVAGAWRNLPAVYAKKEPSP